jgi:hypothetical protein
MIGTISLTAGIAGTDRSSAKDARIASRDRGLEKTYPISWPVRRLRPLYTTDMTADALKMSQDSSLFATTPRNAAVITAHDRAAKLKNR